MKNNRNTNLKAETEEFLNFTQNEFSLFPNLATKCSNFDNEKNKIHLTPYYFCILCEKYFCYYCTGNHLIKNISDKKHNINCIINDENMKIQNCKDILNCLEKNNNNIYSIYDLNKNDIVKEKQNLKNFKIKINKKIDELDDYYNNKLFYINNYYKNEKIENTSIEKYMIKNQIELLNCIKDQKISIKESSNSNYKLSQIRRMLNKKEKHFKRDFFKIKRDMNKEKNESLKQLLCSLTEFKNKEIEDSKSENMINSKREKYNIEEEEEIEEAIDNLSLSSSFIYENENENSSLDNNKVSKNQIINYEKENSDNETYNIGNNVSHNLEIIDIEENNSILKNEMDTEEGEVIDITSISTAKTKERINIKNFSELEFLTIEDKRLCKENFKLINKKNYSLSYLMFYFPKFNKLRVFSVEKRDAFLCSVYAKHPEENLEINIILKNKNYISINADNSLFIFSKQNKNVYRIEYSAIKKKAFSERLNKTLKERKFSSIIYCKIFKLLIIVGGNSNTSEFLDVSKISNGWRFISKNLNKKVFSGKLFILNETKLFVLYNHNHEINCEMLDLEEEIKIQNLIEIEDSTMRIEQNYWTKIKCQDIKINRNTSILNYKCINKEEIIIFEGKHFELKNNKNKFSFYILDYDEKKKEIKENKKEIDVYNYIPYFYFLNSFHLNNLKIIDNNNSETLQYDVNCNFDIYGTLWFFCGNKLKKI